MVITPWGAAGGEVTGSAYLVETSQASILVDCGLFQGGKSADELNRDFDESKVKSLTSVLLTHAHLDHTGRLPLLYKAGYRGPVLATPATIDLTGLILRDSARIQVNDAERTNRKRARAGQPPLPPLYTPQETEAALELLKPVDYRDELEVAPGVRAKFAESGHMLGSTSIQLTVSEGGREKIVVFSGDLGPRTAPILKEYDPFQRADLVFLESTYGDRDHRPFKQTADEFLNILQSTVRQKGKVLVPSFAVGRAQLLLLLLSNFFRRGQLDPFPIFLDSPMAVEATRIYEQHTDLFDEEMREYLEEAPMAKDLKTLTLSLTADDSKKINDVNGPCVVIAGSGMCNGGRISHHLKHNLWKNANHIIFVGFQAKGTLGRRLIDGETRVKVLGQPIVVKAAIHTIGGFSAHAGQSQLLSWAKHIGGQPQFYLVHGEPQAQLALQEKLQQGDIQADIATKGQTITL